MDEKKTGKKLLLFSGKVPGKNQYSKMSLKMMKFKKSLRAQIIQYIEIRMYHCQKLSVHKKEAYKASTSKVPFTLEIPASIMIFFIMIAISVLGS